MNEDFFNYRQRENIRAICFALALIMLFVGFAWCTIRTESLKRQLEQKPNSTAPGKTDSVTTDTLVVSNAEKEQDRLYPMPANLSFTTVTLASNDTSYRATVRIQATILPADASNKSVDWTVAWSGTATRKAENVNDYVEAVPVADGSCIADVTCKKPFGNDAIIICYRSSYQRLGESFRDLGTSARYYIRRLFRKAELPEVTVTAPSQAILWEVRLPFTYEGFTRQCRQYFGLFFSRENFAAYRSTVGHAAMVVAKVSTVAVPCIAGFAMLVKYLYRRENTNHNRNTLPLKLYLVFTGIVNRVLRQPLVRYIRFVRTHSWLWKLFP